MRLDDSEAWRRFRAARVARLATVGADGVPHLVPVTFAVSPPPGAATVVIAVDHKPKTTTNLRRLRNITATGRACILADEYDEDWTRLWWVRLDGRADVMTGAAGRVAPIEWLVAKYPQYQGNTPEGPVIRIEADTITGWAYTG
ncbi:TIGR03668 family PPOX class F420-dependent oxidoreductase [Nocardia sp. alder85J]|uniref:TIGR03668 family PPOX class F420-dependent oxidoreductase n=1 Tax=Nocardia sp. alder85J TaxID=2862949 RepID=UPI001CD23496|nr:TIGR03668 family PPOX class F420-dependent oxidoreductase [Nocardia sp. alder85J]MCX4094297.1 TIGR03668 family PPOX class F420-dependent oxidoreductase [Nocardia sp. alder85J]